MLRKICAAVLLVLLAGLPLLVPALAGGWAVVTLDQMPETFMAGETVEIGFMLRGHGVTPISIAGLSVEAHHQESGTSLSMPARSEGIEGHYLASLNFPEPGAWDWGISAGPYGFTQPMPTLDVLAAPSTQKAQERTTPHLFLAVIWTLASLSLAAAVLLFLRRKPVHWAATIAVAGLAVGGLGFWISTAPASGTGSISGENGKQNQVSQPGLGADLFVAKGCIICHRHSDIPANLIAFQTQVGPDLSNYSPDPAFLKIWLSDPAKIKPDTKMPDLGLSEAEIQTLVSFFENGN